MQSHTDKNSLRVVELHEEFLFVHHRVDGAFADDARLRHLLHCVKLFLFTMFNFPHFAKASSAYHVAESEVVFCYCYIFTNALWLNSTSHIYYSRPQKWPLYH